MLYTPGMNQPNSIESPRAGLRAWIVVVAVLAIASDYLLRHHPDWSPAFRALCALSPLPPCLLYVLSWVRFVRGMDELQRRIQLESRFVACLGALFVITAISALNIYGIALPAYFSRGVNVMTVLILVGIFWQIANAVISRRYR